MNSLIVGLALAGGAAAQLVNGASMVPAYQANYYSSSDASTTTAAAYSTASSSSMGQDYYTSFMSGGYKSMDCGYGYAKGSNGACTAQSWYQTQGCYETIIINQ